MKTKIILCALIILVLCGCDSRECVKSHKERKQGIRYTSYTSGGRATIIPYYYNYEITVCDEWSDK